MLQLHFSTYKIFIYGALLLTRMGQGPHMNVCVYIHVYIYMHVISCTYAHTYLKIAPTNIKSLINEKCQGIYCCSLSCWAMHCGNVFRGQV